MITFLRLYVCVCLIQFITCACKNGAKPCEWEPWQRWSSCSTKCGVGYRTRNRNMCCGPILTDCASACYRGDNNKQVEVCNNSCPNGATLVDDFCQCPPLKYGLCCNIDEAEAKRGEMGCARHCTWLNWFSWGDCSTSCGCGTRERMRYPCCKSSFTLAQCTDDCSFEGDDKEMRPCTKSCSSKNGPKGCSLCSWNNWGSWSLCSSTCGGGERKRSRSPCCCSGQTKEDCLADCGLSNTASTQTKSCNQLCLHGGRFNGNRCACRSGFTGECCSSEVLVSDCKKCSWQAWQAWEETGEDGKMKRRRELCCRVGQSAEDCRSECGVEEYSQVQILLNADNHLEVNVPMNTTTESSHTDLHLYLYAVGISLASVVVTSLAWAFCNHIKKKKRDGRSENKPGNVYQMSVKGQEGNDWYEDVDAGSQPAEDGNYVNVKY